MIRWTKLRKLAILESVAAGQIILADIEKEHGITEAEFNEWKLLFDFAGKDALRATRAQSYRQQMQREARHRPRLRLVKL